MIKVKEVSTQIRGVSYKPSDLHNTLNSNSVILLRANNIEDDKLNLNDVVYVDKSKVSSSQYLRIGDILVCASSGSKNLVGKATIIKENIVATFGAFCKVVRPTNILPQFLGYYFTSPKYRNIISDLSAGANIHNIRNEHIDSLEIPLPPLEIQKQIADTLDKVTHTIDTCNAILEKLDLLVKSRFIEMFGNFVYDKDRWSKCLVGDVAGTVDPQPSHRTPPVEANGIPYIGIAECNYQTRTIDFASARKVGNNVLQEHIARYNLHIGDFIIGKIGTIGKPFFVPAERTYALSANTVLIQPDTKRIAPYYLFSIFQSEYMDRIIDAEKKSTSQPAFGIQKVRAIEIPLPPLELQEKFAAFVAQTDKSKLAVKQVLEKAETLKKALMQEYFG